MISLLLAVALIEPTCPGDCHVWQRWWWWHDTQPASWRMYWTTDPRVWPHSIEWGPTTCIYQGECPAPPALCGPRFRCAMDSYPPNDSALVWYMRVVPAGEQPIVETCP